MTEVHGTKIYYQNSVLSAQKKDAGCKTDIQVPKVKSITLNMGIGEAKNNKNLLTEGMKAMGLISGQKAVVTMSKKAISGFKIRENMGIGVKVTLRQKRMWDFLARLVNVYLPRVRDFHGLSKDSFDGKGNFSIGVNDMRIFPEVNADLAASIKGLSITICTNTRVDERAYSMLKCLGLPFKS